MLETSFCNDTFTFAEAAFYATRKSQKEKQFFFFLHSHFRGQLRLVEYDTLANLNRPTF